MRLNFVAVASHELRTPAAAVYGFAATLRERYDHLDAETQAQMREVALRAGGAAPATDRAAARPVAARRARDRDPAAAG